MSASPPLDEVNRKIAELDEKMEALKKEHQALSDRAKELILQEFNAKQKLKQDKLAYKDADFYPYKVVSHLMSERGHASIDSLNEVLRRVKSAFESSEYVMDPQTYLSQLGRARDSVELFPAYHILMAIQENKLLPN